MTITDNVNYIIINDGAHNSIINKPYSVVVSNTAVNKTLTSVLETVVVQFSEVTSPVAVDIQALANILANYNNTSTC